MIKAKRCHCSIFKIQNNRGPIEMKKGVLKVNNSLRLDKNQLVQFLAKIIMTIH
jgi:hypothetical protein